MREEEGFIKGQSLLELVIAIGLVMVIVTGIALTTINGLKNSQFSKNQTQATKLAQEALEQVRTIRDRDYYVCRGSCQRWSEFWSDTQCSTGFPCTFTLSTTGCTISGLPDVPFCLVQSTGQSIGNFKREVIISDLSTSLFRKRVTSRISWTDISGEHNSELVTILANI